MYVCMYVCMYVYKALNGSPIVDCYCMGAVPKVQGSGFRV